MEPDMTTSGMVQISPLLILLIQILISAVQQELPGTSPHVPMEVILVQVVLVRLNPLITL